MHEIEFSCKNCVFAISDGSVQTGCKLNRLEKLKPDYKNTNEDYYKFNRFCNTFRSQDWLVNHYNDDIKLAEKEVIKEVYPRLSFIINFDYDLNSLNNILYNIEHQTIPHRKFVIVINDKVEYNEAIFKSLQSTLKTNVGNYYVVQTLDQDIDSLLYKEDTGFRYAKNGWTIFLKEGESIPLNFAEIIHNRINIEMKRFIFAQNKSQRKIVIQSAIYKLLNGNKPKVKADETVDNRTFIEKFKDLEQTDPDSVVAWEDLFDE